MGLKGKPAAAILRTRRLACHFVDLPEPQRYGRLWGGDAQAPEGIRFAKGNPTQDFAPEVPRCRRSAARPALRTSAGDRPDSPRGYSLRKWDRLIELYLPIKTGPMICDH